MISVRFRDKRVFFPSAAAVLLVTLWFVSCGWNFTDPVKVESTGFLMNTSVTVMIYTQNKEHGERLIKEAFEEAGRIERIMEPRKGDGELRQINERNRSGWFVLSPELSAVMEEAWRYYELSDGAFDPTIAPVKWLWEFDEGGKIPEETELKDNLRFVGMSRVELRGDSLFVPDTRIKFDLGGVAKGFAVDRMIDYLQKKGVESILVNAGGDIAFRGEKPGEKPWVIGMRHPRLNRTIVLSNNPHPAVATSGDYERCFFEDGVRYHHILDPESGFPARGCISVTVWTNTAMDADILATTIFVLGPGKGLALAERLDNVETCIYFETDGHVESVLSSGVRGRIGL